jgi:hypothetical protein
MSTASFARSAMVISAFSRSISCRRPSISLCLTRVVSRDICAASNFSSVFLRSSSVFPTRPWMCLRSWFQTVSALENHARSAAIRRPMESNGTLCRSRHNVRLLVKLQVLRVMEKEALKPNISNIFIKQFYCCVKRRMRFVKHANELLIIRCEFHDSNHPC